MAPSRTNAPIPPVGSVTLPPAAEEDSLGKLHARIAALETENSELRTKVTVQELTEIKEANRRAGEEIERLEKPRNAGLPANVAKLVEEKVAAGLPREIALEVAQRQVAQDAAQEKQTAKAK